MESKQLDQTDINILNLLQNNGLLSYRDIAKLVHRTHNPISERISRLKKLGYIKNTVAIIDLKKIRSLFTTYTMVRLNDHSSKGFSQFQQMVERSPQIMDCSHLTGQYDFLLKIVVEDLGTYNEFLRLHIATLECIQKVESFPVLTEMKSQTAYLL